MSGFVSVARAVSLRVVLAGAALIASQAEAAAQSPGDRAERLGKVHFEVSCSGRAQREFDYAMTLLHHMTYPQARAVFEQTEALDPGCAMARWGVAMTLFQPLWPTRPTPADIGRGRKEIREARAIGVRSELERLFLEAGAAFFRPPDSTDYWERIRGWREGMERVHAAYPHDDEASVWLALATLAVAPAAGVSRVQSDRAAELLLRVYRHNRDHPGAMHYLIHADDVPGREHEQPDVVRRYQALAPRNPHAIHMPTHIYTRLGEWERVVDGNLRAAVAALERPVGQERLVWDEFPHTVEYAVYAYLQLGRDDKALGQIRRLQETRRLEQTFKTAFHLASTAARYALERRDWKAAAALRSREPASLDWDRFPWAEAVTWFARGLGEARLGEVEEARTASDRLGELDAAAERSGEALFARQIRVLRLALSGWVEQAAGRPDSAVALLRRAAELETDTPKPAVTPAPTLPALEQLGDLLLEQKRPAQALAAYRRSLELYPRRRNSLLGAQRADSALR
jgi:tetratricopeptide (TPR) repeat protein